MTALRFQTGGDNTSLASLGVSTKLAISSISTECVCVCVCARACMHLCARVYVLLQRVVIIFLFFDFSFSNKCQFGGTFCFGVLDFFFFVQLLISKHISGSNIKKYAVTFLTCQILDASEWGVILWNCFQRN